MLCWAEGEGGCTEDCRGCLFCVCSKVFDCYCASKYLFVRFVFAVLLGFVVFAVMFVFPACFLFVSVLFFVVFFC